METTKSAEWPSLRLVKFADPNAAIGMAARMMMDRPVFARRQFGQWMRVIEGQAQRGHQAFVVDPSDMAVGYFGYSFVTESIAQAWADGDRMPTNKECHEGDCILFNAFVANDRNVLRFMRDAVRRLSRGKTAMYFKRFYSDGRPMRPTRLAVNAAIERHVIRAEAQGRFVEASSLDGSASVR